MERRFTKPKSSPFAEGVMSAFDLFGTSFRARSPIARTTAEALAMDADAIKGDFEKVFGPDVLPINGLKKVINNSRKEK